MASTVVDEKIIKLSLDDKKFSDNAAKAISQLQTLDKQRFDNIDSNLGKLTSKFSTMSVIGITAASNLTNKIVDMSIELAKAVTTDPLSQGFSQYEKKLQSMLTLQTSLGKEANGIIKENLEDLDAYANLTVYSIGDMQQALSGFVSSGVDINVAADAIKGMGNVAAAAGVSTARYGSVMQTAVVQAEAMGYMSYENWRQLQDAQMATIRLRKELLQTYKDASGEELDMSTAFTSGLTEQKWLTNDILNTTLARLAVDEELLSAAQDFITFGQVQDATIEAVKTGWSDVFEVLFGGLDEARDLWTPIGNAAIAAVQAPLIVLKDVAKGFVELGGMKNLVTGFGSIFKSIAGAISIFKNALSKAFPINFGKVLFEISEGIVKFSEKIKISDKNINLISDTLFKFFKIIGGGISFLWDGIKSIGEFVIGLLHLDKISIDATATLEFINEIFTKISNIDFTSVRSVEDIFSGLQIAGDKALPVLKSIGEYLSAFATIVGNKIHSATIGIKTFKDETKISSEDVKKSIDAIKEAISKLASGDFTAASDVIVKVKDAYKTFVEYIESTPGKLQAAKIAFEEFFGPFTLNNILLKGGAVAMLITFIQSMQSTTKLKNAITNFTKSLTGLFGSLSDALDAWKKKQQAQTLLYVAVAVGILAAAIKLLTTIPEGAVLKPLGVIATLLGMVAAEMWALSKIDSPKISVVLIAIAGSVLILSIALKKLVTIASDGIGAIKGIGLMAVMLGMITTSMSIIGSKSATKIIKAAGTILAIAISINLLYYAVEKFSTLNLEETWKHLLIIGTSMILLGTAARIAGNGGVGVLAIAASLHLLVSVVKKFGELDPAVMKQGGLAVAGLLLAIGASVHLISSSKDMLKATAAMLIMSGAVTILAHAIKVVAILDPTQIIVAAAAMSALILVIAGASKLASTAVVGAAAIAGVALALAAAIAILAVVIMQIGEMDSDSIKLALITIGVTVAGLIAMGALLAAFAPGLMIVSAAIALFGGSLIIFAGGLAAVAVSIFLFATLTTVFGDASKKMVEMIGDFFGTLANSPEIIGDIIKTIVLVIFTGIEAVISAIAENVPIIVETLMEFFVSLMEKFNEYGPKMIELVITFIISMLDTFINRAPELGEALVAFLGTILIVLGQESPKLAEAGVIAIAEFIQGMADTIMENNDMMTTVVKNFVIALIDTALAVFQGFMKEIPIIGDNIDGAIDGIRSALEDSYDPDATKKNAEDAMNGMATGLTTGGKGATTAAENVTGNVESEFNSLDVNGYSVTNGFVDDINSAAYSSRTSSSLKSALGRIRSYFPFSPAKRGPFSGKGWVSYSGESIMTGFADGIQNGTPVAVKAVDKVMSLTSETIDKFANSVDNGLNITPVITPEFNMKNIPKYALGSGTLSLNGRPVPNISTKTPSNTNVVNGGNKYEIIINSSAGNAEEVAKEVEKVIINKIERDPSITSKIVKNMTKMSNNKTKFAGAY